MRADGTGTHQAACVQAASAKAFALPPNSARCSLCAAAAGARAAVPRNAPQGQRCAQTGQELTRPPVRRLPAPKHSRRPQSSTMQPVCGCCWRSRSYCMTLNPADDTGDLQPACMQAASAKAFALPPIQHDAAFVRLLLALAQLCHDVYLKDRQELEVNPQVSIPVQSRPGLAGEQQLDIQLHHFRYAVWLPFIQPAFFQPKSSHSSLAGAGGQPPSEHSRAESARLGRRAATGHPAAPLQVCQLMCFQGRRITSRG